jgi:hypothetical protein
VTQHDKWLKKGKTVQFKDLGLLFTCSTSREIHLEVIMQIDKEQIIMALERFVSRRGLPVAEDFRLIQPSPPLYFTLTLL